MSGPFTKTDSLASLTVVSSPPVDPVSPVGMDHTPSTAPGTSGGGGGSHGGAGEGHPPPSGGMSRLGGWLSGERVVERPRHIRRFKVANDGANVTGGEVFANRPRACSTACGSTPQGRIWTSAGEGVHGYDPDGTMTGKILIPEMVANVTFGGTKRNKLFICGTTSLYAVMLMTNGQKLG